MVIGWGRWQLSATVLASIMLASFQSVGRSGSILIRLSPNLPPAL